MRLKSLILSIILIADVSHSHKDDATPVDTICEYFLDDERGYVARCPSVILKTEDQHVRFTGTQVEKKTNEDVKYLEIVPPSNIAFLPSLDLFAYYVNLESLDVRNVNIQVLDYIYNCFPLVYITLSHNHIQEVIHDAFFVCRDLQILDLSHNAIQNIHENAFGQSKHMIELDISFNRLTTISRKLFKPVKNLRKLNLENNQIKSLPFNVFNDLFDLVTLDLSNNAITMLDGRLFDFVMHLEWLDLSRTNTRKFTPGLFKSLKRLKYLDISSNPLRTLDGEMLTKNNDLLELRANDCSISDVGKHFFDKITKLTLVEAKENQCVNGVFKGTVDEIQLKFDICIKNADSKRREPHNGEL
jgi:Leucine-rich repeat (LRR) protein